MLLFDAHLDLAWNAIDFNRDITLPIDELREVDRHITGKGRGAGTVTLPEMRKGKVAVCIATLLARLTRPGMVPNVQRYSSMEAAYGAAQGQLLYYRAMEQKGWLRSIKNAEELLAHVQLWEENEDNTNVPLGYILSMEGADPVLSPQQVPEWFEAGLRIIGPTHYGLSTYGHGTGTEGGFFPQGRELLKVMEEVGMILDVTHLSDQCFVEAMDLYHGPVLASHHNSRKLVPNQRQLTDDQIEQLVSRGAVIGVALDNWMLHADWVKGETNPEHVKLADVVDHIDNICQVAGNANHAAIGSDLDGGFGREQSPGDLNTIADLQRLPDLLATRGYSAVDVASIMYENWVRFFTNAWKP
ncbi:MAG: dipeptidase [Gemmataceae bacterium]